MKDQHILLIGKSAFGVSFLFGNICLFGYIITKNEEFAAGGFCLLGVEFTHCFRIIDLWIFHKS